MFTRQPKENNLPEPPLDEENRQDTLSSVAAFEETTEADLEDDPSDDTEIFTSSRGQEVAAEIPPVVNMVEKISSILSPYFIVIVGLFLYEDNFLIGTGLITVGILGLLKISLQDVIRWIDSIKKILNNP